jgi:uncharacterized protein (TIGR03083 family)
MDSDRISRYIDEQRADLADLLATLTPEQWATESLCTGWTVRDVAVHLTHAGTHPARLLVEAARHGFRFNAMIAGLARRDRKTPDQVVEAVRAMVGVRRRPPGTAPADPLTDVLVHSQDIAIPLGIDRTMPIPAAVVAAERLWEMGFPFHARRRFADIEFVATDAPFTVGRGQRVSGPIKDIVLVLAGRTAGLTGLTGQTQTLALS